MQNRILFLFLLMLLGYPFHANANWLTGGVQSYRAKFQMKDSVKKSILQAGSELRKEKAFFSNPSIRIRFPSRLSPVSKKLHEIGHGAAVQRFERGLNKTAERVVPKIEELLLGKVDDAKVKQAQKIFDQYQGSWATYFLDFHTENIFPSLKELIKHELDSGGVRRQYQSLLDRYDAIPKSYKLPQFDLDQYVSEKALRGFEILMMQAEGARV